MRDLLLFLKSKKFFVNLGISIILIAVILLGSLKWLSSYTQHGEFVVVPEFKGLKISQLDSFIVGKDISYKIIDSIYDPKKKSGMVLWQDPLMNSKVKHNRTVYLYVTGMVPPQIVMPKLIDRSERQAKLVLASYGLKVGEVVEREADCNGCVIDQLLNGKSINGGQLVKKGSHISLVVGRKDAFYNADTDSITVEEDQSPNFDQE